MIFSLPVHIRRFSIKGYRLGTSSPFPKCFISYACALRDMFNISTEYDCYDSVVRKQVKIQIYDLPSYADGKGPLLPISAFDYGHLPAKEAPGSVKDFMRVAVLGG
jgi:hypothetical protein